MNYSNKGDKILLWKRVKRRDLLEKGLSFVASSWRKKGPSSFTGSFFYKIKEVMEEMAKSKAEKWLEPDGLLRIEGWARDGLTEEQIAKNMGVSRSTLSDYKVKYPDILRAIKNSKEVADREVENALFNKATGYTVKLKKPMKVRHVEYDEQTGRKIAEYERIEYIEEEVHVPADTTAQIFWLKNRKSNEWRDKVTVTDESSLEKLDELISSIDTLAKKSGGKR